MIVDMMRCVGFLKIEGLRMDGVDVLLDDVLLVGHSLGGACCIANSATIRGVVGTAVMAPTACLHPCWLNHWCLCCNIKQQAHISAP